MLFKKSVENWIQIQSTSINLDTVKTVRPADNSIHVRFLDTTSTRYDFSTEQDMRKALLEFKSKVGII